VVPLRVPCAAPRTASAITRLLVRSTAVFVVPSTMFVWRLAAANASGNWKRAIA
jgi:hypothetical protein